MQFLVTRARAGTGHVFSFGAISETAGGGASIEVDGVCEGISCVRDIRRGILELTIISGDVTQESDIGYSDSVLAPDLIVEVWFWFDGTLTNIAGTGGTGGIGDDLPGSDRKTDSQRGNVAES